MSQRGAPAAPVDDSDLEDLLQHKGGASKTVEEAPLNLDHLTKGQLDVPQRTFAGPGVGSLLGAHCKYLCYMYPRCCGCLSVLGVAGVMFFLIGAVLNPTEIFGVIKNDYTNIQSEYDLSLGKIDHWCLKGDNDSCRCEDPLEPNSRVEFKTWNAAHKENKKLVEAYRDSEMLDVAFVGESLVEEMDGRWMGRAQGDELKGIEKVFKKQFKREKSGMEGVALGIAGDTSPNVLWRLLHGEMPADFNPRVWWVILGMNDLGRMQCSEEVVVLGILRVVEEIRTRKPDAEIVINSMLPMADLRGGLYPQMTDYQDAFQNLEKLRGRGGRRPGPNGNPALYARGPGGRPPGGAGADGGAAVRYQRPSTTTAALKNRHKGTYRGVGPQGGRPMPGGRPLPPMQSVTSGGGRPANVPNGAAGDGGAPVKKKKVVKEESEEEDDDEKRRVLRKKDEDEEDEEAPKKTKQQLKLEKKYIKKVKKDPINPKLNLDKQKIKARDPKKLFLAKNRLPLWTSVNAINTQLRKFAEKHEKISFFDATDIFAERLETRKYVLQSEKISVRGHPTQTGFQEWEEAIATKLKKMFEKSDVVLAQEAAEAEAKEQQASAKQSSDSEEERTAKTKGGKDSGDSSDEESDEK